MSVERNPLTTGFDSIELNQSGIR